MQSGPNEPRTRSYSDVCVDRDVYDCPSSVCNDRLLVRLRCLLRLTLGSPWLDLGLCNDHPGRMAHDQRSIKRHKIAGHCTREESRTCSPFSADSE